MHADVTRLPAAFKQRFDLVYATIGVLSWIEDLGAWMHAAASALRAGGRLALVDIHPLYQMFAATDPLDLDFPYAFDGPRRCDAPGSYADRDAAVREAATIQYGHSLGEIVTAAITAGLRIQALHEHLEVDSEPRGDMLAPSADGRLRLEISGQRLPILFTLIAGRPGPP